MTGKEIATLSKKYLKEYKSNLVTTINQNERVYGFNDIGAKQELKEVIDVLCVYDELEKDLEQLAKYKRAFEIVKRLINNNKGGVYYDSLIIDGSIDITKEEYELLEELMKDAKD